MGYSQNNNLYSFVHGNTLARFTNINSNGRILGDIVQTSLFKNQNYTIQKYFNGLDKNELFFINPTSKVINFSIGKENYELKPNFTTQLNVSSSISIKLFFGTPHKILFKTNSCSLNSIDPVTRYCIIKTDF